MRGLIGRPRRSAPEDPADLQRTARTLPIPSRRITFGRNASAAAAVCNSRSGCGAQAPLDLNKVLGDLFP
jgi:hypothetical protein